MIRFIWLLLPCSSVIAQVISFEGSSFPETLPGWTRYQDRYYPERWVASGWFHEAGIFHFPESPDGYPEDDFYWRSLADFAGVADWFCEFRVVTNGHRQSIGDVASSGLVAANDSGVAYHITIARDRMRLVVGYPGYSSGELFFDISDAAAGHVYRLQLNGLTAYTFSIDGQVRQAGIPRAPYPTANARLTFGFRASRFVETTTASWDYVRFGKTPPQPLGDANCDDRVDFSDIDAFVAAMVSFDTWQETGAGQRGCGYWNVNDLNQDGSVDFNDIEPFVECLIADACP